MVDSNGIFAIYAHLLLIAPLLLWCILVVVMWRLLLLLRNNNFMQYNYKRYSHGAYIVVIC